MPFWGGPVSGGGGGDGLTQAQVQALINGAIGELEIPPPSGGGGGGISLYTPDTTYPAGSQVALPSGQTFHTLVETDTAPHAGITVPPFEDAAWQTDATPSEEGTGISNGMASIPHLTFAPGAAPEGKFLYMSSLTFAVATSLPSNGFAVKPFFDTLFGSLDSEDPNNTYAVALSVSLVGGESISQTILMALTGDFPPEMDFPSAGFTGIADVATTPTLHTLPTPDGYTEVLIAVDAEGIHFTVGDTTFVGHFSDGGVPDTIKGVTIGLGAYLMSSVDLGETAYLQRPTMQLNPIVAETDWVADAVHWGRVVSPPLAFPALPHTHNLDSAPDVGVASDVFLREDGVLRWDPASLRWVIVPLTELPGLLGLGE